jgi:hypothetical protein
MTQELSIDTYWIPVIPRIDALFFKVIHDRGRVPSLVR